MDFSLTTDQVAFRHALRDLLADTGSDLVWGRLAELGLFGLLVAEADGGLGLTEVDAVPLLEEVGYAVVAEPVAETMVAAALAPELACGQMRVALWGDIVLYGHGADRLLVIDPGAVRLARPSGAVTVSTVDDTLRAVRATPRPGGVVSTQTALTRDRIGLATAAQLVGLGRRMLDLTTGYVRARHQFGVPVGSFQAVKHHLADALRGLEFAGPAVLAAAWALASRTGDASMAVSMAAVLATEAVTRTARAALQCHGAIGYTVEYELHRFAKRAWALAATVDIDEHLDRMAESLSLPGRSLDTHGSWRGAAS
jgi:alkylation response protein AidB-like acyl-CoA dehydrogenase